jgi:hypothetical protein
MDISDQDFQYLVAQSADEVNKVVAGMMYLMADTDKKVSSMENQKWYQRMVNTVIGKNKATKEKIQVNNEKLNAYMASAVKALCEKNKLDDEMMLNINYRLQDLYTDNNRLRLMMGAFVQKLNEKINSIDNYQMLHTEIEQGQYTDLPTIAALFSIMMQYDVRILENERKLKILRTDLTNENILNKNQITLTDFLVQIAELPSEFVGTTYIFLQNIPDNVFADVAMQMIRAYHYMSESKKALTDTEALSKKIISDNALNLNKTFSTEDIYKSIIISKKNSLERYTDDATGIPESKEETKPIEKKIDEGEFLKARNLFLNADYEAAYKSFDEMKEYDLRAYYYLAETYPAVGLKYADIRKNIPEWLKKGYDAEEPLSSIKYVYTVSMANKDTFFNRLIKKLKELSDAEDPSAQYELGNIYEGKYLPTFRDYEQAKAYYEKADKKGYTRASNELGIIYLEGKGVAKNYDKAREYFEKGKRLNDYSSYCGLGSLKVKEIFEIYSSYSSVKKDDIVKIVPSRLRGG